MDEDAREQLRPFFEPHSVALVGVSKSADVESMNSLQFLIEFGFRGPIYPVNPNAEQILGIKAYRRVQDIPFEVDLTVVSVPREIVPQVMQDCIKKGVKAIIIISQGFADADARGKELQQQILAMAKEAGIRILGPNTMGSLNAFYRFHSAFVGLIGVQKTPMSFITQSGIHINFGALGSQWERARWLGKGMDLGNAGDIDFADVLEYLEDEPDVKVIALHMESIKDGVRFRRIAEKVSKKKPIVVLKAARSAAGARAAASHTGALIGRDEVYSALFRQAGLIQVADLEELEDLAKAFLTLPLVKGNRVAILTLVGGLGVMAADACAEYGLELATLSPQTIKRIEPMFPSWLSLGNPVDVWPAVYTRPYQEVHREVIEALLEDQNVDAVICVVWCPELPRFEFFDICSVVKEAAAHHRDKPVVGFAYGPNGATPLVIEEDKNVAMYPSLRRAARAIAALAHYRELQGRKLEETPAYQVNRQRAKVIIKTALQTRNILLGEEAFAVLRAYGIPTEKSALVHTPEEAIQAAEEIGYPVAIKVISPQISHKSDVKGVMLGISNAHEIESRWEEMMEDLKERLPEATISGMLIQRMVEGGREVILGAKREEQFGPVLMFGGGGIFTEVFGDVSLGIAPITRSYAEEMILHTKTYRLLKGIRGERPADLGAIVDCLLRLSQLVLDFPTIAELDINPLLVLEKGCVAVDARIILGSRST